MIISKDSKKTWLLSSLCMFCVVGCLAKIELEINGKQLSLWLARHFKDSWQIWEAKSHIYKNDCTHHSVKVLCLFRKQIGTTKMTWGKSNKIKCIGGKNMAKISRKQSSYGFLILNISNKRRQQLQNWKPYSASQLSNFIFRSKIEKFLKRNWLEGISKHESSRLNLSGKEDGLLSALGKGCNIFHTFINLSDLTENFSYQNNH